MAGHLEELLVDLLDNDFNACERAGSGNAGPHEATTQHRDLLDAPWLQTAIRNPLHLPSSQVNSQR